MKKRIPFFSVLGEAQTYLNIVYILIAFPLSIAFFTLVVTGISLSAGLLVIAIGFFIFIGTLLMIRGFRWLDIQLTRTLLGRNIPVEETIATDKTFSAFLKKLFGSPSTWKGFVHYLLIKFPLDTAIWSITISLIATTFYLLSAPILSQFWWFEDDEAARWLLKIFGSIYAFPFLGIIVGMLSLHAFRGFAFISRELNQAMLGE